MIKKKKIIQNGVFPLATITSKKWWENSKGNTNAHLTQGGAIATQEQCSSGGGGNGTCGGGGK